MHLKSLCIPAALACLLAQQVTARNIFVTPGETAGTAISTFTADPFSYAATLGPVVGGFTVLGSTSPTKHYAVGRTSTDAVTVLQGRFPLVTIGQRITLGGTPSAAVLTPDGRFLVIAGDPGVAIIDTQTDLVTSSMGSINSTARVASISPVSRARAAAPTGTATAGRTVASRRARRRASSAVAASSIRPPGTRATKPRWGGRRLRSPSSVPTRWNGLLTFQ